MSITIHSSCSHSADIPQHYPYCDALFDYAEFLRAIEKQGKIATDTSGKRTIIIGAGAAGITAAYELSRCGSNIVLISPAEDALQYGRCYSYPIGQHNGIPHSQALAELGAMRFPPSEVMLFHYFKKFNIAHGKNFPDPGVVDTLLHTNGKNYQWQANSTVPDIFLPLKEGWETLLAEGVTLSNGSKLVAPLAIADALQRQDLVSAKRAWQKWIDIFEPFSFRAALSMIFQQANTNKIPKKRQWTDEQINLFGTLGVGSGGFAPLYSIGFLEIVRLFINSLEIAQQFIPGGISAVFAAMENHFGNTVRRIPARVCAVHSVGQEKFSVEYMLNNSKHNMDCDAVIVTTPNWVTEIATNLTDNLIISKDIKIAIRNQHIISSSKLFMLTQDQFWRKQGKGFFPQNIQSDTLVRGLYCLSYDEDPNMPGVVLISYTWQDDSIKQLAQFKNTTQTDAQCVKANFAKRLVADVAVFAPDFARHLVPINNDYDKGIIYIHWLDDFNYRGAFKLNHPGQSRETQAMFTQFQKAGTPDDPGVYVAGDGTSFCAGWVEGALQTGINAACGVLKRFGATGFIPHNPLTGVRSSEYSYSTMAEKK